MSNTEDYHTKLEDIMAVPFEVVKAPSPPVPLALQEAEDLYHWSMDDAEALKVVGITMVIIKDLPVRTGACREAQSIWNKIFHSQREAQKQWNIQASLALDFRKDLLQTMRFAYRKDDSLLVRVAAITAGDGAADMIQDLNDIAVLGRENQEPLISIAFDITCLDIAATRAVELAGLRARANGDKGEQNESKIIRDKAFAYMKELVDEIREAGKYVFRKDPLRYKGYTSAFWKKKNSKLKKESKISTTTD